MAEPERIILAHGSGGTLTHRLVGEVIARHLSNPILDQMNDFAVCEGAAKLALSTDSFVISPYFFPGGDIGKLAVCGTVNDVAVSGARVRYLTVGLIIEEGFLISDLDRICASIRRAADEAGVQVVSGDTKVVQRQAADGIFINTTGVGLLPVDRDLRPERVRPGDAVILTGTMGDHGIAIMSKRQGLQFQTELISDCAPLNGLIAEVLAVSSQIRCMRDPTRGGVATTLNEIASQADVRIRIQEESLPITPAVNGACDMLGLDPLYVANEGKLLIFVPPSDTDNVLGVLHAHRYGQQATVIGMVVDGSPLVTLQTLTGAERIVDMLTGEQLPRIC